VFKPFLFCPKVLGQFFFVLVSLVLFGLPFPPSKSLAIALPRLVGVGSTRARAVLRQLGFPPALRVADLTPSQERALARALQAGSSVAGSLREEEARILQRLTTNGSRRGIRLRAGLPVNGQRTKSNAQTARRLRRTIATPLAESTAIN
jgi:small subunit ribosomal protein S13